MGNFMRDLPPIICLAMPIIIVWLVFWFKHQEGKAKNRLIEKALELNKEISPEIFLRPKKDPIISNRRLLITGITFVCVGLAAFIILLLLIDMAYASFAFIALLPGIGFLLAYWFIAKELKKETNR